LTSISPFRAVGNCRIRRSSSDGGFEFSSPVSTDAAIYTTLAATPLRRATSVTFAPGANVSSTIRALSSCDQRRRRSNPSKTSTLIA
jgi:hypothetical protein